MVRRIKYAKSTYKPGWLSQIDLRINHIRGAILDMKEVTKSFDETLIDSEVALIDSFTEEIEEKCAKLIEEIYALNLGWEIVLNPECEWWLKKKKDNSNE